MTDPQVEERASSLFWYSKLAGFRGTCAVSCYRVCRFAMSTPTKNTCCQHKHDPMIPAETSSKKKLLQCGTPVAGCLVGRSKPWRELPTETSCITWDHESWRIQGLNTPNNLRMAAFFTAFCKLVNAKEMMPDFDLEFEVDRHYLCEVGHMSHVFFLECALQRKANMNHRSCWKAEDNLQHRGAPTECHLFATSSFSEWPKNGSLLSLRSNRPPISPQRLGLATWKIPAFGMAFISYSCQAKAWYWHYTCDSSVRHCRGRTMICSGGKGAKGMDAYIYTKKAYIRIKRY